MSLGQCELDRFNKFDKVGFSNQQIQKDPALQVPPGGNQVDSLPPAFSMLAVAAKRALQLTATAVKAAASHSAASAVVHDFECVAPVLFVALSNANKPTRRAALAC